MRGQPVIKSDPGILGGIPVFVGTHVPVQSLFNHLECGDSIDVFLKDCPSVTREQVIEVLEESCHKLLQPPDGKAVAEIRVPTHTQTTFSPPALQ